VSVLVLGGKEVYSITAAMALNGNGVTSFRIVEVRDEQLGDGYVVSH
jgi:hypothetical protein